MPRISVTAACFDWDGTLCDSGAAIRRAFRKSLAELGIAFTDGQYKAVYTPNWHRMYEAFGLPTGCWRRADERWLEHYRGEEPELLPGAGAVLDRLSAAGIRLGVVSSGTRPRIERELARLGLTGTFGAVVCFEDVVEPKPSPEGIERALALLGSGPEASCYVGDTPVDIEAGKRAGVFTIGVRSDYVDAGRLEGCAAGALLASIVDLPGIIRGRVK